MSTLTRGILLSGLLAALTAAAGEAQDDLAMERVEDGLHVIYGSGGNVGVRVTPEGVILIDDKFPRNFARIQELVSEVSDQPVRYVLNTHHHGDHVGGNVEFIEIAEIIAHHNARENMVRGDQDAPPRVVFHERTAVHLGGVEVRAYHMGRGHTDGDAVIYFPDLRTVHAGDLLHGTAPFIDYGNGGTSRGWVSTLNNILALDFDTAIPGHGRVMSRDDVVSFRNQMEAVRARMAELIRSGMPRSRAPERIRTPDLSWTMAEDGLFMRRSIPGFYDEIAAEVGR